MVGGALITVRMACGARCPQRTIDAARCRTALATAHRRCRNRARTTTSRHDAASPNGQGATAYEREEITRILVADLAPPNQRRRASWRVVARAGLSHRSGAARRAFTPRPAGGAE